MTYSNAEIARHLHVAPSIVTIWRKRNPPIPNDSLEGAARWRANYAPARGRRVRNLAQVEAKTSAPAPATTPSTAPTDTSWSSRLARVRQTELDVYTAIRQSIDSGDTIALQRLQQTHVQCCKEVAAIELVALECEERAENLIAADKVKAMFNALFTPVRESMDRLPVTEAHHCNPNHPEVARKTLERWVERTLAHCHGEAGKFVETLTAPTTEPVSRSGATQEETQAG